MIFRKILAWTIVVLFVGTGLVGFVVACVEEPALLIAPAIILVAGVLVWAILEVAGEFDE